MSKKGPVLEFFSPAKVALNMEVKHHPELMERLGYFPDFEGKLACAAAYVHIAVDGTFLPEEIDVLCNKIVERLRDKRKIIIH